MGRKRKACRAPLSEFLRRAQAQGKTYAQAQVEETLELARKGKLRKWRR